MPSKSTNLQRSITKAEEVDWYASAEGRRQTQRQFEQALQDGTLVHSSGVQIPKTDPEVLKAILARAREKAARSISNSVVRC